MDNRMDYLKKLNDDLISQFKDQPNTKVLMAAIARQLQDLYEAQEQLRTMRWLSNAVGKQLDGIGDIVVLSRTEAARLELGKPDASAIDDEVFRKYLYYKIFLNTSTGTRREIMKALRFFWDEAPLYYSEETKYPATIFVSTPELSPEVPIERLLEAPIVKPGGVRFIVRINTRTNNDRYDIRHVGLSVVKNTHTGVPETEHLADVSTFKLHHVGLSVVKSTDTEMPEAEHLADVSAFGLCHTGLSVVKITKTNVLENEQPIPIAHFGIQHIGLSAVKRTKTEVPEIEKKAVLGKFDLRVIGSMPVKSTKTEIPEAERKVIAGQFDLRIIRASGVKRTTTRVSEIAPPKVSKTLRTAYAPQWSITRAETGGYTAIAGDVQRYKGLSTVKITNTPLAAYGGD